jgi:hypothetical protein
MEYDMYPLPSALKWMVPSIWILALVAAAGGLWPGEGEPYAVTNFRGTW